MRSKTIITHITSVGGNVFADLGFPPEEAAALKAESNRIIAKALAAKATAAADPAVKIGGQTLKEMIEDGRE